MQVNIEKRRKPNIRISETDHLRLSALANAVAARSPAVSEELFAELERARIVPDSSLSADVVRMGSTVTFKPDNGDAKTVMLVFPSEADISASKISILTPIGTALIGLSLGQSIMWTSRDGHFHELSVLDVSKRPPKSEHSGRDTAELATRL